MTTETRRTAARQIPAWAHTVGRGWAALLELLHHDLLTLAAYEAVAESAVAGQPGEGAFDDPTVSSQALAGLDAFACDADTDALAT